MLIMSISTVAVHLTAVLKFLATSTASWKPMAVIAKAFGVSMVTRKSEKKAKNVAIRYACVSMRKAVQRLTEDDVTCA